MVLSKEVLEAMDPQAREALFAAISAAKQINAQADVVPYTPKSQPEGMYLKVKVGEKSRESWFRLNDGGTLDDSGRQALKALSKAIEAHI